VVAYPQFVDPPQPYGCQSVTLTYLVSNRSFTADAPAASTEQSVLSLQLKHELDPINIVPIGTPKKLGYGAVPKGSGHQETYVIGSGFDPGAAAPVPPATTGGCQDTGWFHLTISPAPEGLDDIRIQVWPAGTDVGAPYGKFGNCATTCCQSIDLTAC
jgi:hypothetical protein